jgi:hypothetical protein
MPRAATTAHAAVSRDTRDSTTRRAASVAPAHLGLPSFQRTVGNQALLRFYREAQPVKGQTWCASTLPIPPAALQSALGNHAASRVLQRLVLWTEPAANTAAAPVVQSITLDRLPGSGGGKHTTSFQVFLETVQNAVVGASYTTAIARLKALADDVCDLPGWDANKRPQAQLKADFDESHAQAGAVTSSQNHSYWLEILASDYVKLRNSIEFVYHTALEGASTSRRSSPLTPAWRPRPS